MTNVEKKLLRAGGDGEVDSEGSWAVSYGDMVTLLLMFFILFFSIDKERDRFVALQKALLAELAPKKATDSGELLDLQVGKSQGDGIDQEMVNEWGGKVTQIGSKILIEFPAVGFFGFGRTALTKEGRATLRAFSKRYLPYAGSYLLTVRAFTDTVPVAGNGSKLFKDNLELSALRSVAALRHLQRSGVPLGRMRSEGYGEMRLSPEDKDQAIAEGKKNGDRGIKLARKVILIVEPETRDKL